MQIDCIIDQRYCLNVQYNTQNFTCVYCILYVARAESAKDQAIESVYSVAYQI